MDCEVVLLPETNRRGRKILEAMIASAPMPVRVRDRYVGDCALVMIYGIGEPTRQAWFRAHVASGRHAIGWDLGYWSRDGYDAAMRVTVDRDHPQAMLRPMPADRFQRAGITLRDDAHADGHVVLVGMGRKSAVALRQRPLEWEQRMLRRLRSQFPNRRIVFRPKGKKGGVLPGCTNIGDAPIADVLRGASLVVCRHSNVAVDACVAGIPVVCEDGAAATLYGNDLSAPRAPSRDARLAFLHALAWWQWTPSEAARGDAWRFLRGVLQ